MFNPTPNPVYAIAVAGTLCLVTAGPALAQPADLGACCLPGGFGCTYTTPDVCLQMGGAYRGVGSDCFHSACHLISYPCCLPSGNCTYTTDDYCRFTLEGGSIPSGCESPDCDEWGACCLPGGQCQEGSLEDCNNEDFGRFISGISCDDAPCDNADGACCFLGEGCVSTFNLNCTLLGGSWMGLGTYCSDVDEQTCGFHSGACCEMGLCTDTPPSYCYGDYYGNGTSCAFVTCPQPGACCDASGWCFDTIEEDCQDDYLEFRGEGTTCAQVECPVRIGACCEEFEPGMFDCYEDIHAWCVSYGGVFFGDGTLCDQIDCETSVVLGACCLPSEACVFVEEPECLARAGIYQGDDITCDAVTCGSIPTGACCLPDESCVVVQETQCGGLGGVYQGDDVTCAQVSCVSTPTGACCHADQSCTEVTLEDCQSQGGSYEGDDTLCSQTTCDPFGRCCLPAGGCAYVPMDVCFGQLAGTSWAQTTCEILPCPPVGACCLESSCELRIQSSCEEPGYDYMGDETNCPVVDCAACPGDGYCYAANGTPSCDDPACCHLVCETDPTCCSAAWDQACADLALAACTVPIIAGPIARPDTCHRYYLLDADYWFEAEETAITLGGHLVTINDSEENEWVRANLANYAGQPRTIWIGFTDQSVEGNFVWISGEPVTYTNWSGGEPNDAGGEDYGEMNASTGQWNDNRTYPLYPQQAAVELPALAYDCSCDAALTLTDHTCFVECLTGPGFPTPPAGCDPTAHARMDRDRDGDLDLADFAEFQSALAEPQP